MRQKNLIRITMSEFVKYLIIVALIAGVMMAAIGGQPVRIAGLIVVLMAIVACQFIIEDEQLRNKLK